MKSTPENRGRSRKAGERPTQAATFPLFATIALLLITPAARAQGFSVLHDFGPGDGRTPFTGLSADPSGNL
jgi:hypothetical protein